MQNKQYLKLRDQVSEMNKIHDEISLINWNKEDGPKFSSVEEMKEFENSLNNNELDYLFGDEENANIIDSKDIIIESFTHKKDDMEFIIYTYQKNIDSDYMTYLSLTNIKDNDTIDKLCGRSNSNKDNAHHYFETLKTEIMTNTIDEILESLIIGAQKTIIGLNNTLSKLTSES